MKYARLSEPYSLIQGLLDKIFVPKAERCTLEQLKDELERLEAEKGFHDISEIRDKDESLEIDNIDKIIEEEEKKQRIEKNILQIYGSDHDESSE